MKKMISLLLCLVLLLGVLPVSTFAATRKVTVGPAPITINQNEGQPKPYLYYSGLEAGDKVSISATPIFEIYATSGDQTDLDDPVNFMGKYTIVWVNADACTVKITDKNNNTFEAQKVKKATLNVIPTKAPFEVSGIKTYATVDGYAVNLHQFSDENMEEILENPAKDGTIELKFKHVSCLKYINTVRIPTEQFQEIAEAANDAKSDVKALEVTLANGRSIKMDAKALANIAEQAEGKFVAIVMVKSNDAKTSEIEPLKQAQKRDLGDRPAYAFEVISGNGTIKDVAGSFVMQIPYELRYKETEEGMKVYAIAEDGERAAAQTSYDAETKKVVWEADALGLYVIEHEKVKK